MNIVRESLLAVAKSKRVWLLQLLANPVLVALAALWLLIPEAQTWQVVLTIFAVLILVAFFLWLHASTFAYFAEVHVKGAARFRRSLRPRNLLAFAVWALILIFLMHVAQHVSGEFQPQLASYFRSIAPSWLRRTIAPPQMDSLVALKFWVLMWIIIPALLLPSGLQTSIRGFGAFRKDGRQAGRRTISSRIYWSVLILLAIAGVYLPNVLISWLPKLSSVKAEGISLTLRLVAAWLLTVSSWTLLISVLGCLGRSAPSSDLGRQPTS